jgi:hypothetical protein
VTPKPLGARMTPPPKATVMTWILRSAAVLFAVASGLVLTFGIFIYRDGLAAFRPGDPLQDIGALPDLDPGPSISGSRESIGSFAG